MQFWGKGKIGNQDFEFGAQGNKAIYFRDTREELPRWEDVMNNIECFYHLHDTAVSMKVLTVV